MSVGTEEVAYELFLEEQRKIAVNRNGRREKEGTTKVEGFAKTDKQTKKVSL